MSFIRLIFCGFFMSATCWCQCKESSLEIVEPRCAESISVTGHQAISLNDSITSDFSIDMANGISISFSKVDLEKSCDDWNRTQTVPNGLAINSQRLNCDSIMHNCEIAKTVLFGSTNAAYTLAEKGLFRASKQGVQIHSFFLESQQIRKIGSRCLGKGVVRNAIVTTDGQIVFTKILSWID